MTVRTIDEIWRDFNTNGVPASGAHKPIKADIRDTLNAKFDEITDVAIGGIKWKDPVRVATTASGTWASAFDNGSTIDGVVIATGNRILIKNQTAGEENGIYVVQASGAPVRATDADTSDEILRAGVYVEEGTTNGGTQYVTMTSPITLNTTPIVFTKVDDNGDTASEVTAARFGLPSLSFATDMARNSAFTEFGDNVFDPNNPLFRSGRYNLSGNIDDSIGRAQPFQWDGTRFDYVKVWVRPVAGDAIIRVGIWSADRATLYASGYVNSLRTLADEISFVWVKLNRAMTTTIVAAGVLYFSVDGITSDTNLNGRIAPYAVDDRNTPNLVTYPLYRETYTPVPSPNLVDWAVEADAENNGTAFELYDSRSIPKRVAVKSNPRPDEIVMSPRLFGIVNTQMNVYTESLVAGRKPKSFFLTGLTQGRQLKERWTSLPTVAVNDTLSIRVLDADNFSNLDSMNVTVNIVAENAAAAAPRVICAMGDSTTANGLWIQRVLDKKAANANGVQAVFQGTRNSGVGNNHEGVGGRRLSHFYQPTTVGIAADNPFVTGVNQYFDATYYMSDNPSFVTPDIVIWHLGLNEMSSQIATSETLAYAVAAQYCRQLGEMIGVFSSVNPIVPWSDVDPNIKHIVALPIATGNQDGAGAILNIGQDYHEGIIHRYMHILRNRIVTVFGGMEASGIFLMPWHVANDPVNGFDFTNETWNVDTARTVDRQADILHPASIAALGGYQQMGDSAWATLNGGVALGLF